MLCMLEGAAKDELEELPAVKAWVLAFNKIWRSFGDEIPTEWLRQVVIPLYKGHGRPPGVVQSYRGISITHHIEAVLHRIIINRLADYADQLDIPTDSQFGFRQDMNTEQAIAQLRWLLEDRVLRGRSARERRTYCAFLDVRSAFDSVWREGLCVKLFDHGVRGRTLAYLRHGPLMAAQRTVRVEGAPKGSAWSDTRGVAQGVVGAPFAYSVMAADLIHAVKLDTHGAGIRLVDGSRVHSISYADDIVLIAESAEGLQHMLNAAQQHARRDRFDFEPDKCEVVVFGAERDDRTDWDCSVFYLDGHLLRRSEEFRYLGVPMHRHVKVHHGVLTMSEARRRNLLEKVHGEGRRLNLLRVSAADPVMTPLDTRMIYLGIIEGIHHYAAASEVRGLSELADALQIDAARIIARLPDRKRGRMPNDALRGDLGLQDASAAAVKAALRLFQRVCSVPADCQLARIYRSYKQTVEARHFPRGNWMTWLQECLQFVRHPEYESIGWPTRHANGARVPTITEEVDAWQQRVWLQRVRSNALLTPHYAVLCRHRELAEYMREGTAQSRRAILRFRCDQIAAEVTRGRYADVPRHLRYCQHCTLQECEDSEHVLLRCPSFAAPRAEMMSAVERCMPPSVRTWAGELAEHPDRWMALLLDGELEGVPFSECYGRSTKAIRSFKGFWSASRAGYRKACHNVISARKRLRESIRHHLVAISRDLANRCGFSDWR
ncbi:reverse transcriptase family protein [Candidatus Kaiserbacteria bacterium]|nr:reverse transcriptase family protein [Candidatus Kaiserbacteria bacterium]